MRLGSRSTRSSCCGSSPVHSFQVHFTQAGIVEYVYGNCAVTNAGTGWSPGLASMDPGSMDLSALTVLITGQDRLPLSLSGASRPIVGTSVALTVGNVPATSLLGALIFGLTKFDPGINLAGFGMPDCFQDRSQDAVSLLLSAPTRAASSRRTARRSPACTSSRKARPTTRPAATTRSAS